MKRFFHIPLLQCCKPFRLKETQTEASFLAGNVPYASEAQETAPKDSTSYSLEYDTSAQNNSSYNYPLKNTEVDPNSCGRCTKCRLVKYNQRPRNAGNDNRNASKVNFKSDLILSVELEDQFSPPTTNQRIPSIPIDISGNRFYHRPISKVCHRSKECSTRIVCHSVLMFYFKTSVIMINTFQNNSTNSLNFSQAIHLKKIIQNTPISVHPLMTCLSFRCIQLLFENHYLSFLNDSLVSKIKISSRGKPLHQSIMSQTKFERPLSIRPKDKQNRNISKAKEKPIKQRAKPQISTSKIKAVEKTLPQIKPEMKPEFMSLKTVPYNKVSDYKEFLDMWKKRRKKPKNLVLEKKDISGSIMTTSPLPPKSPDSQTKEYMIRFINKEFKKKPTARLKNPSFRNSFSKTIRSKHSYPNQEKPLSDLKDQSEKSRNRIIEILVEMIYEKVIILMVEKLSVLSSTCQDDLVNGFDRGVHPSMDGDSDGILLQSDCNDNPRATISSTSNTGDFTASTAFDIISDQAYSDNSDCPLST